MLTSKWTTLNHHYQKFKAIYKWCHRLKKSGENEVDLMGRARVMYQDESRNSPFNHDKAWAILRQQAKWDAPEVAPVELTEDETGDFYTTVNTDELFGADPRPRPPANNAPKKTKSYTSASTGGSQSSQFGEFVSHELRLKREAAEKAFEASKDKDETFRSLEELPFLALSTKDLSDDDAYWIERKKAQIKAKLRAEMQMEPNNEEDSDE
nr:glutathione S-transferase T3-like [Tanacetum cinerariifolium]